MRGVPRLRRASCRPLAEDDVHREVLHRRIEDLFDLPVQAVDLINEQEVAFFQRGHDRRHVSGTLQGWPARRPEPNPHLLGEDTAQRRLAKSRRAVEQYVVQRLIALLGSLYEDPEVLLERLLSNELVERARPERWLVVLGVSLGVERMLTEVSETRCPCNVLRQLPGSTLASYGEVVHLLRAQRLLPIRRNASFMYFSTESCGGTSLSAFSASSSLYPSAVSASRASTYGPPPPPPVTTGSGPKAARLLPLSSSTSRSAVFFPRPGTEANLITSPLATVSEISGGDIEESTERASFGPTLLTAVSASNAARSSRSANPNRSIASSRTTNLVWMTHSSPSEGSARRVASEAEDR